MLRLSGFEVGECMEAGNGEEALAQLSAHAVDVILTDINMPGMNGEELLRKLGADGILKTTPAVVISTDATNERILRMIALGAEGYMSKPFTPESLREELERVLGERDASTKLEQPAAFEALTMDRGAGGPARPSSAGGGRGAGDHVLHRGGTGPLRARLAARGAVSARIRFEGSHFGEMLLAVSARSGRSDRGVVSGAGPDGADRRAARRR